MQHYARVSDWSNEILSSENPYWHMVNTLKTLLKIGKQQQQQNKYYIFDRPCKKI